MSLGGVPFYLKQVERGETATQAIQRLCFERTGLLRTEFGKLYVALFDKAERHVEIIRALASKRRGLTRTEIVAATSLPNAGSLTRLLTELEQSDFIARYPALGNGKRGHLYRLTDEYSGFYLQVMEPNAGLGEGAFLLLSQKPAFRSWAGYAFESVCIRHVAEIKSALGISGLFTQTATYQALANADTGVAGVQIDLLLDRADDAITLIEAKFGTDPFVLTKAYAEELRGKVSRFRQHTGTRKQVFLVLISPYGVTSSPASLGLVDGVLTQDALFG